MIVIPPGYMSFCTLSKHSLAPYGVTFFNSGFKSDPTELFLSIVLVIAGEKRFPPPNFNLTPKGPETIFKPFLEFGQAIVKAIFIKNS
jgi:hypothetical protein